ncbi:RNA polymerase sigma factor [Dyadobacter sediminis]|uniref:RNA polymerase sigma factor n=1 Tax=Dyadobacter sediminis TaxID=1493691 RepID=A0A5R9KBN0_9BACT|nr:RNA polymerase sigma factor [Dyadobacter sediminis]TLU92243.1 RNA polymerase sigma factor [Dyadobacter sediminis]GGB96249.1 RNA polymerase sigma factor SigK [Dyadobacter sediminis]
MNKSILFPENELVTLLKNNNKAAYEYLYDHYAPSLYGIARKIVKDDSRADDVMQDSFIKIWKHMASYDAGKGSLFTWMLNITRRTAIDKLRADNKFEKDLQWDAVRENDLSMSSVFIPLPATVDLKSIVEKLLPEKKQLIELVYFEGYTHEEASEHLCLPLGTVKSRIRNAMKELRKVFDASPLSAQFA